MGLFDDLKKKTEQFTSDVATKTQQGLDTMKLNSAISAEEKKIKELFAQLGENYWNFHKDDPEENLSGIVGTINASKKTIEEFRKQIVDIKLAGNTDGIICRNCGAVNKSDSRFCEKCGKELKTPEQESVPELQENEEEV